jgi:hypothetical protein
MPPTEEEVQRGETLLHTMRRLRTDLRVRGKKDWQVKEVGDLHAYVQ